MNDYFKQAQTWADDNFGRLEQTKNRYQIAFLSAMGLNAVALIAIAMLSHYQTIVPLLVHHYNNGVATVEVAHNAPINRSQIESDIARYIEHRESYDVSSYRTQFELIHLLSNNTVEKEYLSEQDKNNPASPITLLNNKSKREVHIYNINFLDAVLQNEKDLHKDHHNLAEVVFSLTDTDKFTGKSTQTHYNALIAWEYNNPPSSPEERWLNWDGFEVIRYSKSLRSMGDGA